MRRSIPTVVVALATTLFAGSAVAQPLGTFRWQQLPYCNVITVRVEQAGNLFQLDGVDDQCGAATQASAVGLAFQNPSGTIGMGLTIVTAPGGTPLHIDATITLPSASGTWRDSAGNTGAFALTQGTAAPGLPRPAPKAAFPGGVSAGNSPITNVGTPTAAGDAANKDYVDALVATRATTADVRAALVGEKVWKAIVVESGAKFVTGPYTSTRQGSGSYTVRFDVTGLGLPFVFPAVVVAPLTSGVAFSKVSGLSLVGSAGVLAELIIEVGTFNAAGVATDSAFSLMWSLPDANAGSPVPPLDRPSPAARCTTEGEITSCVYAPGR